MLLSIANTSADGPVCFPPQDRMEKLRKLRQSNAGVSSGVFPHRSMIQLNPYAENLLFCHVKFNEKVNKPIHKFTIEICLCGESPQNVSVRVVGCEIQMHENDLRNTEWTVKHNGRTKRTTATTLEQGGTTKAEPFKVLPGDVVECALWLGELLVDRVSANFGIKKSA